jgi:hypothetical protein
MEYAMCSILSVTHVSGSRALIDKQRGALLVVFVATLLGCGSSLNLVPVEGTVTLNGEPLADASVTLLPTNAESPGPFTAQTDASGKFSLGRPGDEGSGAQPGRYYLMITTVGPVETDQFDQPIGPVPKEIVPAQFSSGTYRFEVPEAGTTDANWELTGR